jgi:hypothetical protein
MVPEPSILVALVQLVDQLPQPPTAPRRGRPAVYSDRLFLKALVSMIGNRLPRVHTLLMVLEQPTPEMQRLRALLQEQGRYPTRRTWERRLGALPETLPAHIGCLGRHLVDVLHPWLDGSPLAAMDSTVLRALGGVWHKKDREAGIIPHSAIDPEAHWTKSGWQGWVYGWKLHLVVTVAAVWLPLAAELTPANVAENEVAPRLLPDLPPQLRFLLGDTSYDDSALHAQCAAAGRVLVTSKRGAYPHTDEGVEVRRVFHQLRAHAIENFNGQFKAIFDTQGQVPTRGLLATRRYVLGAVLVYPLTLLYRHQLGADLRVGLKPFLKAAC